MKQLLGVYQHQYDPNNHATRQTLEEHFHTLNGEPIFPRMGHAQAHMLAGEYTHGGKEQSVLQQLIEEGWTRPEAIEAQGGPIAAAIEGFLNGLGALPHGGVASLGKPEVKGLVTPGGKPSPGHAHEVSSQAGTAREGEEAAHQVSSAVGGAFNFAGSLLDPKWWVEVGFKVIAGAVLAVLAIWLLARALAPGTVPAPTSVATSAVKRTYRATPRAQRRQAAATEQRGYRMEQGAQAHRRGRERARQEAKAVKKKGAG